MTEHRDPERICVAQVTDLVGLILFFAIIVVAVQIVEAVL